MMKHLYRVLAFVVCAIFLLPIVSCSGTAGAPDTFSPVTAIDPKEFSIAYLVPMSSYDDSQTNSLYTGSLSYLQSILKRKGWNVDFRLDGATVSEQTMGLNAAQAVQIDIAAGTAADGYTVTTVEAKELLDAGLSLDLSKLLPDAAPALYDKSRKMFGDSISGLPLMMIRYPMGKQLVFYIQKEIADDSGIRFSTVDDLLSLLEKNEKIKIGAKSGYTLGCLQTLLNVWAGEQGYYPLENYYIDGGLCAAYSDPLCSPVPIENIAGFDDIFTRCLGLYQDNRIVDAYDYGPAVSDEVVGYVGPLYDQIVPSLLLSHGKKGNDYTASVLTGGAVPVLPADEPYHYSEMAVSASSARAEQVIRFVQWALMDREGYDLMQYGVKDVDYRMDGQRIEYLNHGKALTPEDWDGNSGIPTKAFFLSTLPFFYSDDMERATVYAPDNYETVAAEVRIVSLPIMDIQKLRNSILEREMLFGDIANQFQQTIEIRDNILMGFPPDSSSDSRADCLEALHGMSGETSKLANAYGQRVKQIIDEQAKSD